MYGRSLLPITGEARLLLEPTKDDDGGQRLVSTETRLAPQASSATQHWLNWHNWSVPKLITEESSCCSTLAEDSHCPIRRKRREDLALCPYGVEALAVEIDQMFGVVFGS